MIDKGMNKQDLRNDCNVSGASVAKMAKGKNITTDILLRICKELECDIGDICEVVWDPEDLAEREDKDSEQKKVNTMRMKGSGKSKSAKRSSESSSMKKKNEE